MKQSYAKQESCGLRNEHKQWSNSHLMQKVGSGFYGKAISVLPENADVHPLLQPVSAQNPLFALEEWIWPGYRGRYGVAHGCAFDGIFLPR